MSLQISQSVKLRQTLSQKTIQSVSILQMNALELSDYIAELALERIRELNPFPAQGFDTEEAMQYVTPDITIVKFPDHFEILLNQYSYPEIRVNKYYLKLLRSDCDQETKEYLSAKLKQIEETQEHIARRGSTRERKSWKKNNEVT